MTYRVQMWTVVRFPDGSWSYGGKPDDPDYEFCEVWRIPAKTGPEAKVKAQAKRRRCTASACRARRRWPAASGPIFWAGSP